MSLTMFRPAWFGRRLGSAVLAVGLTTGALVGLGAAPVSAEAGCTGDLCVVVPDTVQTPLGLVTVTVSATNVVTVQLAPTAPNTLVLGVPFSYPPGPPSMPGYARTSIDTAGGLVTIDTFMIPPGPPLRWALRNLAIISIHPPSPCRALTTGTTVVFTPIYPPGPLARSHNCRACGSSSTGKHLMVSTTHEFAMAPNLACRPEAARMVVNPHDPWQLKTNHLAASERRPDLQVQGSAALPKPDGGESVQVAG